MSIISGTAKSAGGFYDFPIENSLRFDGSSYLSKTPSSGGSKTTWTLSVWFKLTDLEEHSFIFGTSNTTGVEALDYLGGSYYLRYYTNAGSSIQQSEQLLRDTSSWYHIIAVFDSTNVTSSNRMRIYLNGYLITLQAGATYPSPSANSSFNNNSYTSFIGKNQATNYWNGYLANIQFLDGTVPTTSNGGLDASTGELKWFGETKSGVWIPKAYTGSYGTNGFRLAFNLSDFNTSGSAVSDPYGSATNLPDGYVADASGSGNHWQVN